MRNYWDSYRTGVWGYVDLEKQPEGMGDKVGILPINHMQIADCLCTCSMQHVCDDSTHRLCAASCGVSNAMMKFEC